MRILFVEAVQNFGGARKSTVELAKRLNENGHSVKIVDFWGCCSPFVEAVVSRSIDFSILDPRKSPFIINTGNLTNKILNSLRYFHLSRSYKARLNNLVGEFQPNLIIVNNTKTLFIINKSNKYKIAYFARGWFLPTEIGWLDRKIVKRKTDIYIGVSQATRQAILAGGFAKLKDIFVVPNAINYNEVQKYRNSTSMPWDTEVNDRPFVILHSGGFLPSKGQHIIIEIAKVLKTKGYNFKFLLTGIIYQGEASQKYYQTIVDSIEREKLNDCFEIILNKSNVLSYFSTIDILLHPSSSEGLPRVVMEAMAFGKPVIGNPVGGMLDYILHGYTGFLTDYNNVSEYSHYCSMLIEDKLLYKRISRNCANLIQESYGSMNQLNHFDNLLNTLPNDKK